MSEGHRLATHADAPPSYMPSVDAGFRGGGTYTNHEVEPTMAAYENIFGPSARDIKQDLQRFKRHGRWHLPDILKGPNQYLTDRVDGLITDATNSPFTSRILPYKYITNVDGKIKWNVWSFDEGLASRVPYESAARTLTQTKRSYAGYTVRQGMAIVLEHNFMMTEAGRQNFKNQLQQLVGSIQLTNDLDVHMALVLAPSHEKHMRERYMVQDKSSDQICREFVDLFGFVQKNQNALDILIEEAKAVLRTWGSPMPDFMLCNSKLTFQLTMTPDATNYVTKGAEGVKRLRTGPDLPSYRGIGILHTRAFSLETGQLPRDILRRRVRVAEYYRIPPHRDNWRRNFQLYNEGRDTWATFTFWDLLKKAGVTTLMGDGSKPDGGTDANHSKMISLASKVPGATGSHAAAEPASGTHPRLGAPLGTRLDDDGNAAQSEVGELLFTMLTDTNISKEFVFNPTALSSDLVYAPGADTLLRPNPVYTEQAQRDRLPKFMQLGFTLYCSKFGTTDISPSSAMECILKANSICSYPRTLAGYRKEVNFYRGNIRDLLYPETYIPLPQEGVSTAAALDAVQRATLRHQMMVAKKTDTEISNALRGALNDPAAINRGPRHQILTSKLSVRNYLQYGIPLDALRDRSKMIGRWSECFDPAFDRDRGNHTLAARLRDLGSFNHPNVFSKGDHAEQSTNLGDYLGYHCIVTDEMLTVLAMEDPNRTGQGGDDEISHSTWLYTLILQSRTPHGAHSPMFQEIGTELIKIKDDMADGVANRIDNRIKLSMAIRQMLATLHNKYTLKCTQACDKTRYYWLWPNISEEKDVFDTRNNERWATAMRERIPSLYTDGDVTEKLLTEMEVPEIKFPLCDLNEAVSAWDAPVDAISTAVNFVNMLGWRLWSDRSVPLRDVYNAAIGRWPRFDQYIHRALDYPANLPIGALLTGGRNIPPHVRYGGPDDDGGAHGGQRSKATENVEVVIVRPNIEHYMLGVILGQGGESLGSTFWGQTELSCYDDSMHGIWGMSYKYNERAIVINEKNLVRLWDIAYDGYVGGKEDSAVDWDDEDEKNPSSQARLCSQTMDVTMPYRGPSMMVMCFDHTDAKTNHAPIYEKHLRSNWPSPIVFYDRKHTHPGESLAADFDNIHVVQVDQFRVFDNDLYNHKYQAYHQKMPDFWELHRIRKNAGQAAVENEVSSDALAFQGTMRVLNSDTGNVIQEILGSGHHGPDFIGCASLRAGKGYKINSQPTIQRLV